MPWLLTLLNGLITLAGTWAGKALIGLGIGAVTYTGVSTAVGAAKTMAFGYLNQAAAVAAIGQFLGLLQIGTCINILFSAYVIRLTMQGLTGDTVKKWVTK